MRTIFQLCINYPEIGTMIYFVGIVINFKKRTQKHDTLFGVSVLTFNDQEYAKRFTNNILCRRNN